MDSEKLKKCNKLEGLIEEKRKLVGLLEEALKFHSQVLSDTNKTQVTTMRFYYKSGERLDRPFTRKNLITFIQLELIEQKSQLSELEKEFESL